MFLMGRLECHGMDEFHCIAYKIKTGVHRLGSNSLTNNAGAFLIFAVVLLLVNAVTAIAYLAGKYNTKVKTLYEAIKRKLFWNAFIRYIF